MKKIKIKSKDINLFCRSLDAIRMRGELYDIERFEKSISVKYVIRAYYGGQCAELNDKEMKILKRYVDRCDPIEFEKAVVSEMKRTKDGVYRLFLQYTQNFGV